MGLFHKASVLSAWLKTWGSLPVLSWIKAASHYRNGDYEGAAALYSAGLKKHPNHKAQFCARLDLAYCLFKLKQFDEAQAHLKFIVSHCPASREGHLRLARLHLWLGQAHEAAWALHHALRHIPADAELAAIYLLAVLENDGPAFLLKEAAEVAQREDLRRAESPRLDLALACYAMRNGKYEEARQTIDTLASRNGAPFESALIFAELLLEDGELGGAREELRRALAVAPEHPRVLSLMAESYLRGDAPTNVDFAVQLGVQSCQASAWKSPREMHILAEAYLRAGDKFAALVVASKAKEVGARLMGPYREARTLDRMIDDLSSSSLA